MTATRVDRRELTRAEGLGDFMPESRAALMHDANPLAGLSLLLLLAVLGAGGYWANGAVLDVVTRGHGQVIPSSREQVIQSLEGGILAELKVREGDVVEAGQELLRIDDTRTGAALTETEAKRAALRAAIARLHAEASGDKPQFPSDLPAARVELESNLFSSRHQALEQKVGAIARSLKLAREELAMTAPLVKKGVVSEVEVLRLRRQVNDLAGQIADQRNAFRTDARAKLAEKESSLAEVDALLRARSDQVRRSVVRSPVRGTVKRVRFNTVGGVIRPGEDIMEIVPLEDRLLVEARIRPRDVAFLRPGLPATVKISAYNYTIYGGLHGVVEHISADTIPDQRNPDKRFYRIRVRTDSAALEGKDGPLPIIPGMGATVEVLTGHRTVLEFLLKPILRVRYGALHER